MSCWLSINTQCLTSTVLTLFPCGDISCQISRERRKSKQICLWENNLMTQRTRYSQFSMFLWGEWLLISIWIFFPLFVPFSIWNQTSRNQHWRKKGKANHFCKHQNWAAYGLRRAIELGKGLENKTFHAMGNNWGSWGCLSGKEEAQRGLHCSAQLPDRRDSEILASSAASQVKGWEEMTLN